MSHAGQNAIGLHVGTSRIVIARRAEDDFRFDPAARFPGVAANEQPRRLNAVRQRAHQRSAKAADRRWIQRVLAGDATNAVGAEETRGRISVWHW